MSGVVNVWGGERLGGERLTIERYGEDISTGKSNYDKCPNHVKLFLTF